MDGGAATGERRGMAPPSDRDLLPFPRVPLATTARTLVRAALMLAMTLPPTIPPPRPLGGQLRIVGSRAMAAPVAQWVTIFRRKHPDVRVSVALYGTGTAAAAIRDDLADVAPVTRAFRPAEQALFVRAPAPRRVPLRGAAVLYVSRSERGEPLPAAAEFARIAHRRDGGFSPFLDL